MKKIYFQPACMIVELGTCKMMAESIPVGTDPITDPDDVLTNENNGTGGGKNIWDEEW